MLLVLTLWGIRIGPFLNIQLLNILLLINLYLNVQTMTLPKDPNVVDSAELGAMESSLHIGVSGRIAHLWPKSSLPLC